MRTEYLKIDTETDIETQLFHAAEIIKAGGLVVFPTETVYGLGASALDSDAAKKIYAAKGRPSDNPLIIHISKPEDAGRYCHVTPVYKKLAEKFLPGPLTVIMKKREMIPDTVTAGLDTVAVRCPENEVARAFIEACGLPIAAPSANISGSPSPTTAEHCRKDLDGRVDMIIDGGPCTIGLESTIIKLDGDTCTVLRPGAVTPEMLGTVIKDVRLDSGITEKAEITSTPLAPGMKYRHYAPKGKVALLRGTKEKETEFLKNALKNNPDCGILCFDDIASQLSGKNIITFGSENDQAAHAEKLFSSLREFDEKNVGEIYITIVKAEGLDLATYNRMLKASGYTILDV